MVFGAKKDSQNLAKGLRVRGLTGILTKGYSKKDTQKVGLSLRG